MSVKKVSLKKEVATAKPPAASEIEEGSWNFTAPTRVKFYLPHNKALQAVGEVTSIDENGIALVEVEPDGKIFEQAIMLAVPVRDLQPAGDDDTARHVGDRG